MHGMVLFQATNPGGNMTKAAESKDEELLLRFDHNVIEHLGLKLYQNRPTSVIAELVSNGWDADAEDVWVDLNFDATDTGKNYVAVSDNGIGMSFEDIRDRYLVIGKPKRSEDTPDETTPGDRKPMGRKGIGKLAPFGIARIIDVVTVSKTQKGRMLNWFRLDFDGIAKTHNQEHPTYAPDIPANKADASKFKVSAHDDDTGAISKFLEKIDKTEKKTGTLVVMRSLTLKRILNPQNVTSAMGRRFTVTVLRDDFTVHVNDNAVTKEHALPKFEQRIPSDADFLTEQIDGKDVRYWVGFVEQADWPQDEAGVGVYLHGKIAQDRPFTFGQKGKEIFSRYMYGVVEADWLDELPEDVISTDRTSIDWEHDATAALYEWGRKKVRIWLHEHEIWRQTREKDENLKLVQTRMKSGDIPKFSSRENETIASMVSKITPSFGKGTDADLAKDELLLTVANAWSNRPTRELLKGIWDKLSDGGAGPVGGDISKIVSELTEHSVPEFMGLGVTFSQRAYALSLMYELIYKGREVDLQALLEEFPWILNPEAPLLTANQTLKTTITQAILAEDSHKRVGRELRTVPDSEKPDFVFLCGQRNEEIVVVEIKHPDNELTIENRRQLQDYLDHLSVKNSRSKISGVLIGSKAEGLKIHDERISSLEWGELFERARIAYVEMMAAMLKAANPDADDARLAMMAEFGGEQAWELLTNLADKDEDLADLFQKFKKLHTKASVPVPVGT